MSRFCFCPIITVQPQTGVISGSRDNDGHWNIEFDVVFSGDRSTADRTFSTKFEEAE